MSSAAEKQHTTKLSDAKGKLMEVMMRKSLYFFQLVRIDDVTPSWKLAPAEKYNMQDSKSYTGDIWCFGLSKIVSAKYTPSGFVITKWTLFVMDCKAMKGGDN